MADLHFELVTPEKQVMSEDVSWRVPGTRASSASSSATRPT